jgi:hypothetical protein
MCHYYKTSLSIFFSERVVQGFPTGTKHHKSQNEKAKPVLEQASARIRMGTRSKTGNASFRTGNFLIRVLTCSHFCHSAILPFFPLFHHSRHSCHSTIPSAILFRHSVCCSAIPAIIFVAACGGVTSTVWLRSLHACICNFFQSTTHIMTNS